MPNEPETPLIVRKVDVALANYQSTADAFSARVAAAERWLMTRTRFVVQFSGKYFGARHQFETGRQKDVWRVFVVREDARLPITDATIVEKIAFAWAVDALFALIYAQVAELGRATNKAHERLGEFMRMMGVDEMSTAEEDAS